VYSGPLEGREFAD